jgi:hypothetical protein
MALHVGLVVSFDKRQGRNTEENREVTSERAYITNDEISS